MQFKRTFLKLVLDAGNWVKKHPGVAYKIKPYLKRHPHLWEAIKRIVLFGTAGTGDAERNFLTLSAGDVNIRFALGPLDDKRGIGRVTRHLRDEFTELAKARGAGASSSKKSDVYFYSSVHWCPEVLPRPCVVMIHDVIPLIYPELFEAPAREWNMRYRAIAQQADQVLAISHATAQDVERYLGIDAAKIRVVYNGVTRLPVSAESPTGLPGQAYLVYLGSYDIHKNLDVVLKALGDERLAGVHVVMIGDNEGARMTVAKLGLKDRVHFLGRLSDEDTGYVISKALALVFPSLYEGFGLPPLEAALLGVPSICSERPAMNEIMAAGARFVSATESAEWVDAVEELFTDSAARGRLATAALGVANTYTWEKCGAEGFQLLLQTARRSSGTARS